MTLSCTEVSITIPEFTTDRFLAYATISIEDCFVIKHLRIIVGSRGKLLVQMPSRRCCVPCLDCHEMVPNDSVFCPKCGHAFRSNVEPHRPFEDLIYPVNGEQREVIEQAVLEAYGILTRTHAARADGPAPLRGRIRLRHGVEVVP